MSDVVIYQPWGGLGDNLAHSIIPDLCKLSGRKCYLSMHNAYRNDQIYKLVWENNPNLEKERVDSKDLSWLDRCKLFENKGLSHVQVLQKCYGFDTQFEYPKIYYKPNYYQEFKNVTLIDFNSISVGYDKNILKEKLLKLLEEKGLKDDFVVVTHTQIENNHYDLPFKTTEMDINNLFMYSDILFSCKNVITLNSGITNLASTIKNQFKCDANIYTFTYKKYLKEHGSNGYFYSNNNYIPVD